MFDHFSAGGFGGSFGGGFGGEFSGGFNGGLGERGSAGVFNEQFRAFSAAFLPGKERDNINFGSKIILPPSALARLSNLHIEYPMLFELSNLTQGKSTHGGVLEFIAEEGRCYLPRWMMQALLLQEGELIVIKNVNLPLGTFVKIQPQTVDFLDIYDPRAVLEQAFRSYSTLTKDDIISISYNNKQFDLLVLEVKPSDAVSIVETDLEVDFAPPVGYIEPDRKPSGEADRSDASLNSIKDSIMSSIEQLHADSVAKSGWNAAGSGKRLVDRGTNAKPSRNILAASEEIKVKNGPTIDPAVPLRVPLGTLFFGYKTSLYISPEEQEAKRKADQENGKGVFEGEGRTLRAARRK